MNYLIIILIAIIVWREIAHYLEVRFYKQWINELLEKVSGVGINTKSKVMARPLTDEEEASLEMERDND